MNLELKIKKQEENFKNNGSSITTPNIKDIKSFLNN